MEPKKNISGGLFSEENVEKERKKEKKQTQSRRVVRLQNTRCSIITEYFVVCTTRKS